MQNSKNKPTVPEVLPLVKEYYKDNPTGGCLHIVLDDGNIEDSHVKYCLEYSKEKNDLRAIKLSELLLQMSKTQRKKIYISKHF